MPLYHGTRRAIHNPAIVKIESIEDSNIEGLRDSENNKLIEGGESFAPAIYNGSETTILTGTTSSGDWHGRASVVTLSNGNVVLCYRSGTAHKGTGGKNDGELHIRFSDDYGATWTAEDTKLGGGGVTGFPMYPTGGAPADEYGPGEPWLYLAPNGDLLLHMWKADYNDAWAGAWQAVSSDNGESWGSAAQIDILGTANDDFIFTTDDHFVLNGVIYAGGRELQDVDGQPQRNILITSTDHGTSWTYISQISSYTDNTNEVGLEYIGSNTILAIIRDNNSTITRKAYSYDMGQTWTSLEDITSDMEASGRHRVYTLAHLKGEDRWWEDDTLIVVGFVFRSPGTITHRHNALWISEDAGDTWTLFYCGAQTTVSDGDAGYGDIFYDPDNDQLVYVTNWGTTAATDLIQYRFDLTGIS